ncbi:MAG: 1-acyl-sn-glycerol-3-phosphate acyltransferase [Candidatus Omnitrophica bacterium]|nr:1-acyl-sn-glycerol-3-phosphate acyltransferase [Candidatus Omnitrophota bacterium]
MAFFIRVYRIAALIIWSAIAAILSAPSQLRAGWKGVKDVSRFVYLWNKGVARIINLRVKVSGKVPSLSGGLVVSNHLSYIDIVTHGSTLPVRYSPKSDIAKWPLLGWYLALSRPIWIDRRSKQASKKALEEFAETMNNGMYLIVYPEGTSTDGKNGILPFKSTSFEAAIASNAPIIPVLTSYRQPPGEPTVCWYGDMTLLPHAWQVLGFPTIEAELRFLEPVFPEGRPRKELASLVHEVMSLEYEKGAVLEEVEVLARSEMSPQSAE